MNKKNGSDHQSNCAQQKQSDSGQKNPKKNWRSLRLTVFPDFGTLGRQWSRRSWRECRVLLRWHRRWTGERWVRRLSSLKFRQKIGCGGKAIWFCCTRPQDRIPGFRKVRNRIQPGCMQARARPRTHPAKQFMNDAGQLLEMGRAGIKSVRINQRLGGLR